MGHVQDSPVSTNMISNVCMIYHMKVCAYALLYYRFQIFLKWQNTDSPIETFMIIFGLKICMIVPPKEVIGYL